MILRPSASYLWSNCAAYPTFKEHVKYEPQNDDAAREGTCAAWVAEQVFKGVVPECMALVGTTHENGWLVTAEMAYHVQGYVNVVNGMGVTVVAEQSVSISARIKGSLDSSTVSFDQGILKVIDLKYGYKRHNPYQHTQILIYGIGEYRRQGSPASITHVELSIYQPRSFSADGPLTSWIITIAELLQWEVYLIARGDLCYEPNPVATPGAWCESCPVAGCQSRLNRLYSDHETINSFKHGHMSADDLANVNDFIDEHEAIVKGFRTALDAETEQRIKSGENIRGRKMETRLGNRKFTSSAAWIEAMTGIKPLKEVLMSPAELEAAGANKIMVKQLSTRPSIGAKIKKVSDADFARVFGQ